MISYLLLAVAATVGYEGNLPKIFIDGRSHEPLIDCCGHPSGGRNDYTNICAYIRRSTAAFGHRILNLGICDREYLRGDGTYDWSVLDDRAKMFLEADPEAKFLIGIRFIYEDWAKRHPGEQVGYACRPLTIGSGDEYAGAPVRPSSASQPFRAAVFRDLAALAEHVRAAPWGERVVAVRPCYGCSTEWFSYGTLAFPDCGQAMTAYFRNWLRRRYGSDAALRAAWHDGSVSLDTATVPSRREQAPLAFFLDAAEGRRAIDFNRATADSMADLLLAVAGEIKRLLPGRLVGAYYGYVFEALPGSCAVGLYERVLSSGLVDFFSNPPAYCHDIRKPGGDYGQKIVPAALRRYGKIPVVEDDSRLHFMSNWATKGWCMADARADRAILRRNVLNTFFDGGGYQICDPAQGRGQRLHSFDDPGALDALREAFAVLRGIGKAPNDSGADMALVITPEDKFFTNTQYFRGDADERNPKLDDHWNVYRGIPLWLHRSGAAFDILTLDDLLASKKTYRKLVFQSAYAVDVARRKALLRLTRREGTTSVWFVAPGSITDDGFSDRAMSDLVGMELTGAGMNPSVTCRDASAKQIDGGWVAKLGKETFSVFRTAVPTSAESAGRLMETIGEHRYVKADAYVRRLGDYLMVHVGKAGRYEVCLPKPVAVRELFSGVEYPAGSCTVESEGPETWLFKAKGEPVSQSAVRDPVISPDVMRTRFERFAATDEELYTNAYCNAVAFDVLKGKVPRFECPDEAITDTYYFRWWTYRKHLRKTKGTDGWVVTEFLPDVSWAGPENTISCAFGHHVREGRWLRDPQYLDGYIDFMLKKGNVNGPRSYVCWPAWSSLERAKVTGDLESVRERLDDFVRNFEAWSAGWPSRGLSLRNVENRQGAGGVEIKVGFRPERGLFDVAGDREGSEFALSSDGARPLVNAAMWAESCAIAEIAQDSGREDLAARFSRIGQGLERDIKQRLWNREKDFFTTLSVEGEPDGVCELNGYAPFYFGMDLRGFEAAWKRLVDVSGFSAPFGLTFPSRDTPGFDLSDDSARHECLWNGPSWPYATSIALTALYESLQDDCPLPVSRDDFVRLLGQYARQHVLKRSDGRVVPWIDENLDPLTGEWIARRRLLDWDRTGVRKMRYRERGKDYNHSTFCDLVIAGLCGLVPQKDGSVKIRPMAPASWDWWCVDGIRYHGSELSVLFDRAGTRYGRGKGLVVLRDGAVCEVK